MGRLPREDPPEDDQTGDQGIVNWLTCNPRISSSIPGARNLKKLLNWMKIHGHTQIHNKDAWVR